MIIWLASYPKSGNTWLRVIISNIINSEKKDFDKPFNFLKQIDGYPNENYFRGMTEDYNDPSQLVPNWIRSQNLINLKKGIKIFKTHNMLGSFGSHKFTDTNNTIGVIYIVRDPRNVVSSIQNHYQLTDLNAAASFMLLKDNWISDVEYKGVMPSFISSWNFHYLSWKTFKKNYLLIKYEDLLKNTSSEVLKIYNYLKKFYNLDLSTEDLDQIVKLSSFNNLQRKENEDGFEESMQYKNKKVPFFRHGASNDWKKELNKKVASDLEKEFSKEMKELGYL